MFLMYNPCCCELPCVTHFTDNFTRANSSNIGADWTEVAGDWSISSNTLQTSDSDSLVIYNTDNPDGVPECLLQFTIPSGTSVVGNNYKIIAGYDDVDNYYWVNIEVISASGAYISLYSRTGGVDTLLNISTFTISGGSTVVSLGLGGQMTATGSGEQIAVRYCLASSRATLLLPLGSFIAEADRKTGLKVGLGTGTLVAAAVFDVFLFRRRSCATRSAAISHLLGTSAPKVSYNGGSWTTPYSYQIFQEVNQESHGYNRMFSTFSGTASDTRCIVGWVDTDNYICAEISSVDFILRIIERVGGVETTLGSSSASANIFTGFLTLAICYSYGKLFAEVRDPSNPTDDRTVSVAYATVSTTRTKCGYGTGANVTGGGCPPSGTPSIALTYDGIEAVTGTVECY